MMLVLIGLLVLASCLVGYGYRKPIAAEYALYHGAKSRAGGVGGFYVIGGVTWFVIKIIDRIVLQSVRHGAPAFNIKSLSQFLATTPTVVVMALVFGWVAFDIHEYAGFSYLPADATVATKLTRGATYVLLAGVTLYFAYHYEKADNLIKLDGRPVGVLALLIPYLAVTYAVFLQFGGGAVIWLVLPLVPRPLVKFHLLVVLCLLGCILYAFPSQPRFFAIAIVVIATISACLAWIALRVTVELLTTVGWYDSPMPICLSIIALSFLLSFVFVIATPSLSYFAFVGLDRFLPDRFMADWRSIVETTRNMGRPMSLVLAVASATPMIPLIGFTIDALGAAIGNLFPQIARFCKTLAATEGELTSPEVDALLTDRSTAYFIGYAIATFVVLSLTCSAIYIASAVILGFM